MLAMPEGGKMMRENVATTSAELNGVPSWNFTPSRSLKVYVLPSDEIFQLSARSGMIVLSPSAGLKRTRLLYICPTPRPSCGTACDSPCRFRRDGAGPWREPPWVGARLPYAGGDVVVNQCLPGKLRGLRRAPALGATLDRPPTTFHPGRQP